MYTVENFALVMIRMRSILGSARDISAEMKGWSDRKADGVAGAFQNIGKQAVMHEIGLQAKAGMSDEVQISASPEAVERLPIRLPSGGR